MVIIAFTLNIIAVYSIIQYSLSSYTSKPPESSLSLHQKPKISLAFTTKYLILRLAEKTYVLGQTALNEDDLAQWKNYHYLENLLYSSNDVPAEVIRVLSKNSPDFIKILKHERGYDSDTIKAFETYNNPDQ